MEKNSKTHIILVIVLLALFLISMRIMRHYSNNLINYIANEEILDLRMGYSFDNVIHYLNGLGEDGRKYYSNTFHLVDTFYPIIYFAFYVTTLSYFIKRIFKNKIYFIVLLVPLLGIICDYGENIFINSFIKNMNNITEENVMIANYFTRIKFISVYLSLILIIILMVLHIINKLRIKISNRK
jgi:cytochrome b561